MRKPRYCAGCGEKKPLRFAAAWCSQRCAAYAAAAVQDAGSREFHCLWCGYAAGMHQEGCGGL